MRWLIMFLVTFIVNMGLDKFLTYYEQFKAMEDERYRKWSEETKAGE